MIKIFLTLIVLLDTIPRDTGFTREDINEVIIRDFVEWLAVAGDPDYTDISFYDRPKYIYLELFSYGRSQR